MLTRRLVKLSEKFWRLRKVIRKEIETRSFKSLSASLHFLFYIYVLALSLFSENLETSLSQTMQAWIAAIGEMFTTFVV